MRSAARIVVATLVSSLSLLVVGAASGAPGGPQPCQVDLVGLGTANGSGHVTSTLQTCHASLPDGVAETQRITGSVCAIVVTRSGRVNAVCHP